MSNHTTVGISRFNSVILPKSRADTAVVESDESMADQTFQPEVSCLNVEVPKHLSETAVDTSRKHQLIL